MEIRNFTETLKVMPQIDMMGLQWFGADILWW